MARLNTNRKLTEFYKLVPTNRNGDADGAGDKDGEASKQPTQANLGSRKDGTKSSLASSFSSNPPQNKRVVPSSDGEESSEDSDLEDPTILLRIKDTRPSKPPSKPVRERREPSPKLPTEPKLPSYNFDLDRLLKDKGRTSSLNEDIRRATLLLESCENEFGNQLGLKELLTAETAEEIMNGEGADRLLSALRKQEATQTLEEIWELFDYSSRQPRGNYNRPFPTAAIKRHEAFSGMIDSQVRNEMFLSGMVKSMISFSDPLPDEVLLWMLDQVCLETREDLAFAYTVVLQISLETQPVLSPSILYHLFEILGGKKQAIDLTQRVKFVSGSKPKCRRWRFWNVKLLVCILGVAQDETAVLACGLLIRMALDVAISLRGDVLTAIEDSFYKILERIPNEKWDAQSKEIADTVMCTVIEPKHRLCILKILPVSSPRVHLFHRRLAMTFLFEDSSYMTTAYDSLVHLRQFGLLLGRSQFRIGPDTDYVSLQSLIGILDIAIDNGSTAASSISEKDREVDHLVDNLRLMFSKIIDTNAQNLAKTEAKDAIERLQFRLTFSVRSRQKMALDMELDGDGKTQSMLTWGTKSASFVS